MFDLDMNYNMKENKNKLLGGNIYIVVAIVTVVLFVLLYFAVYFQKDEAILKTKYLIPQGTVALWDFCRDGDYLTDIVSGHKLTPINITRDKNKGAYFDGSAYLEIKNSDIGNLDVSKYGEEVTVMALINPSEINVDYIAGLWTEDDNDPHREYGLFIDLPKYGGSRRVVGHVSRYGGASPGIPYSRDYAASGRTVTVGRNSFIGMTYDGHIVKSFLDGLTDIYMDYQESGLSYKYDKNPYVFNLGLNKKSKADFNVGANLLTSGMCNYYKGYISKLIVVARALSEKEIADMAYFYCKNSSFATFPNIETNNVTTEATQCGFKTRTLIDGRITDNIASNNSIKNVKSTSESSLYFAPSVEATALAYIESEYIHLSQVKSFSFKVKRMGKDVGGVRLCIKVGDNWYASKSIVPATFFKENTINVDSASVDWMKFDFCNLNLMEPHLGEIENKRINAIGVLFCSVARGSSVSVSNIKVNI